MKKRFALGMVTLLVAIPSFSQIKADDNFSSGENTVFFQPSNGRQLPFINYHGFRLQSDLYQPKGFQGVLVPKARYEKPNWIKPKAIQNSMPRYKPQPNQKIKVAKPDSSVRYH